MPACVNITRVNGLARSGDARCNCRDWWLLIVVFVYVWGTKHSSWSQIGANNHRYQQIPVLPSQPVSFPLAPAAQKRIKIDQAQQGPRNTQRGGHPAAAGTSRCDSDMWRISRFTSRLLHCLQMLSRGTAWPVRVACTIGSAVLYRVHVPASR
jgi:hypothetical protein